MITQHKCCPVHEVVARSPFTELRLCMNIRTQSGQLADREEIFSEFDTFTVVTAISIDSALQAHI